MEVSIYNILLSEETWLDTDTLSISTFAKKK